MIENKLTPRRFLSSWLNGLQGGIAVAAILFALVYVLWLNFKWGEEETIYLIDSLFTLPLPLLVTVAAWLAFKRQNLEPRVRRLWLLIALAFLAYFIGEAIWIILEIGLGLEPFPSIADVFYLLFYPLIAIGLFSISGSFLSQRGRLKFALDILLILLTTTMLMWYFIIQPTAGEYTGEPLTQIFVVAYPVGDVLLVLAAVGALLRRLDYDTKLVLWIIFLGMGFHVAGDIDFAYTSLLDENVSQFASMSWMLGSLFFLFAALRQTHRSPAHIQNSNAMRLLDSFAPTIPTLTVLIGSATVAAILVADYQAQVGLLAGVTLAIIALFIIRMYLSLEEVSFRNRLAGHFVLLATTVLLITLTSAFVSFRQESRASYQHRLLGLASMIALQQDGDLHATLQAGDEETETYQRIRAQNAALLATNPDIAYIYTMRRNEQNELYFVVDTDETTNHPEEQGLALIGEIYPEDLPEMMATFDTEQPAVEREFSTDEWGTFLSAFAPFYSSDGTLEGIVGVDITADDIIVAEQSFLLRAIGLFIFVLPLIALIGWLLGNALAAPIESLVDVTARISTGNFTYSPVETTIPEIQRLDHSLASMTQQLKDSVGNLEARVAERTRALQASIDVSHQVSTLLDQDALIDAVVREVQAAFDYYHVHIYLFDDDGQYLNLVGGTGEAAKTMMARGHRLAVGQGLVGQAASNNSIILSPDVRLNENWMPNPILPETRAEIAVPIGVVDSVLGVLDVQHNVTNGLSATDSDLLQSVANQVATAFNNARIYEQVQRQAEREQLINRISQQIQQATSVEAVLQIAAQELGEALDVERASVHLQSQLPTSNGRNH